MIPKYNNKILLLLPKYKYHQKINKILLNNTNITSNTKNIFTAKN